jgi:small conductance mechanosensitive channel
MALTAKWERLLDTAVDWWLQHGSRIILILVGIWVGMRALRMLVALMNRQINERPDMLRGEIKQARTATTIVEHTGTAIILFVGALLIAAEMGFNPTAILASAGIVGVALGFGAQSLVKDLLAGCFILFEDQFGVGDVIRTGVHVGEVEVITLRTTCLRDPEGAFIIVPNGDLGRVTNYSKHWAKAVIDVDVADDQDLDRVFAVLQETAVQLATDWPDRIIAKPEILGIERMTETGVSIRIIAKTAPLKQWEVSRELRKRIKSALYAHGIAQPIQKQRILGAEPAFPADAPPAALPGPTS